MPTQKEGQTYYTLEETRAYLSQKAREDAIVFARKVVEKQQTKKNEMYV